MRNKPFKTYEEQLQILKGRGLSVDDETRAIDILSRANYYNIVNGYKKVFLKRNLNGNIISPEEYKENSTFEELYSLYSFPKLQ